MICELLPFVKTSVSSLFFTGKKKRIPQQIPRSRAPQAPPTSRPSLSHTELGALQEHTPLRTSGGMPAVPSACQSRSGSEATFPMKVCSASLRVSSPFPAVAASVLSVKWSICPIFLLSPHQPLPSLSLSLSFSLCHSVSFCLHTLAFL